MSGHVPFARIRRTRPPGEVLPLLLRPRPLPGDGRQDLSWKAPYGPDPIVFGIPRPAGYAPVGGGVMCEAGGS